MFKRASPLFLYFSFLLLTFKIIFDIIVACETVAYATIFCKCIYLIYEVQYMPKFMKMLNNISRSQSVYRHSKISATDLHSSHYAFVLAICRESGRSQEELAKELCLNKSTVARTLNSLEEKGYITRTPLATDKRQFAVHPTEKMLAILPEVKNTSIEWMSLLSEGIPQAELEIFNSVLERMQDKARKIIEKQEENK